VFTFFSDHRGTKRNWNELSTPFVDMKEILLRHRKNSLEESLNTPLEFKIPTTKLFHVQTYPDIFQLADSGITDAISYYLSGISLLGAFSSESSTVMSDAVWIKLFRLCCPGVQEYFNQKDRSSMVKLRPDVALYLNGALFLKGEQKARQEDMGTAEGELDKLHEEADLVFPFGSQSILGFTSSQTMITTLRITKYQNNFITLNPQNFDISQDTGRVDFLVHLMKFLRYVVAIDKPNLKFHLAAGLRKKTRNGHHITWIREGILKEYSTLRSDQQMEWIGAVYQLSLPHVEHGYVLDAILKTSIATRVGRKLNACITDRTITRDVAFAQIQSGVQELHDIGFAHCDICVDNCLVDVTGSPPTVFLDDLEYIRPVNYPPPPPPHNSRLPPGAELPSTAEELDYLQLQRLQIEMFHI
jgi:hypothetical protein